MTRRELDGRRVAVTGASGFIGSHVVVDLVASGADVVAIDAQPGWREHLTALVDDGSIDFCATGRRWPYGTLLSDALDGVDTVVHLGYAEPDAASDVGEMRQEAEANLVGSLDLIEQLPGSVTTIGFASTSLVYGRSRRGPLAESLAPDPDSAYAIAKVGVEQALRGWIDDGGGAAVAFRFSTVYGPTETVPRAIPNFVRRLLAGQPPQVAVPGDARDYVHVTDVARAVSSALAAHLEGFDVLNVGTGVPTRTDDLARLVAAAAGIDIEPEIGSPGRPPIELVSDPELAASKVGFQALVDLCHGLPSEIDWFRDRPELWAAAC